MYIFTKNFQSHNCVYLLWILDSLKTGEKGKRERTKPNTWGLNETFYVVLQPTFYNFDL